MDTLSHVIRVRSPFAHSIILKELHQKGLANFPLEVYFIIMKKFQFLCGGLFAIECARFSFLTGVLALWRFKAGIGFPWHIYAVPNALFLLTALFLWLDLSRYSVYLMLFISGKLLSIFSAVSSLISLSLKSGVTAAFEAKYSNPSLALTAVIIIDLITIILAFFILFKSKKSKLEISEPGVDSGKNGGEK